jgi:arsenate reductase
LSPSTDNVGFSRESRSDNTVMNDTIITVYGIPNCDTVKKARTWLAEHRIDAAFHDFKKQGVPAHLLPNWVTAVGWDTLVNRKGTTWRKLDEATQAAVVDPESACALMMANPSVIKRPVVVWADGTITVGFSPAVFEARSSEPGALPR